ncbi:ATP-grasp domain-containing protein [Solwaraspora sp. WMMB335]|uniref:ATP-grasp domain-containing protein n=1 Tax=Solwaraspora sp. WMMB335 TaxID=3404118 RepID=UPI003B9246B9
MKTPIILLDRLGFDSSYYRTPTGESLFPEDRFDVRLITSVKKLPLAVGNALQSVVATPGSEIETLLEAGRYQSAFGGAKAERVVALTERQLLPAATLREALDIPGDRPEDIVIFRDKVPMKGFLRARGVRVPCFAPYSAGNARDLLQRFGTVVVKPRLDAGSKDVNIVCTVAALEQVEARYRDRLADFEVEEFIDGRIYHIDSVVQSSRVLVASVGRSVFPTTSYQSGSHYWDIELAEGPLRNRLLAFNQRVIECYPDFTGVMHHEAFVSDNEVVFCEIAARWGGGGIRAGFRFRTGIDLIATMLNAQLGGPIPASAGWSDEITGFSFLYISDRTLTRDVTLDEPWLVDLHLRVGRGDKLPPPRSLEQAAAVITVSGRDEAQVAERLAAAEAEITRCFG